MKFSNEEYVIHLLLYIWLIRKISIFELYMYILFKFFVFLGIFDNKKIITLFEMSVTLMIISYWSHKDFRIKQHIPYCHIIVDSVFLSNRLNCCIDHKRFTKQKLAKLTY